MRLSAKLVWLLVLPGVLGQTSTGNTTAPASTTSMPPSEEDMSEIGGENVGESDTRVIKPCPELPQGETKPPFNQVLAEIFGPETQGAFQCAIYTFANEPVNRDFPEDFENQGAINRTNVSHPWVGWIETNGGMLDVDLQNPMPGLSITECVNSCTAAIGCNYITYLPLGNDTGRCSFFRVDKDCVTDGSAPAEDGCMKGSYCKELGFDLSACPGVYLAQDLGFFESAIDHIFGRVNSKAAESLAISASVITIVTGVLGAPFSILASFFKV